MSLSVFRLEREKEKRFKQEQAKRNRKYRRPSKTEISLPCAFQHVVSVDQGDSEKYFSLQAYVNAAAGDTREDS